MKTKDDMIFRSYIFTINYLARSKI